MTRETVDAFDLLPAETANDAVRAVENAIDAHVDTDARSAFFLDGEQGPGVVRALLELGWTPPPVKPKRVYADEERHVCPRREEAPPGWLAQFPDHDRWELRDGRRCCSWCGSANPDDLMAGLRDGSLALGPTDKDYKAYVHGPVPEVDDQPVEEGGPAVGPHAGKFYFQHLSVEQCREFLDLLNAKAFRIGYPGHFYRLPFFAVRGPAT